MIVLGIETSCDETSAALVEKKEESVFGKLLNQQTLSQIAKHRPFGGVVPELSFREHSNSIDFIVRRSLEAANISLKKVDAFAATTGPGLLGGLIVGSNYAKGISVASKKPFLAINHLQAHVLISRMEKKIEFPFLCLLVSGGHTQILVAHTHKNFEVLGETLDDAVGEAFDKTAKLLNLQYPGGPEIEKLAKKASCKISFNLPRPLINKSNMDFSFSGIKTSVRNIVSRGLKKEHVNELARDFQEAVTDCLVSKVDKAIELTQKKMNINDLVVTGGVASNIFVRTRIEEICKKKKISFSVPEPDLCTDNATMVAWAGIERIVGGETEDNIHILPKPRWSIENL